LILHLTSVRLTGNGIDFFDPATATFTHWRDQRVKAWP
jgi:hypothetical protein